MRLIIHLRPDRPVRVPLNSNEPLQGAIYRLLGTSDADFARFLHHEGYTVHAGPAARKDPGLPSSVAANSAADAPSEGHTPVTDSRRFKLFTYSGLRVPASSRRLSPDRLHLDIAPGSHVTWQIASPVAEFLTHCATGLLAAGTLRVGSAELPIAQIDAVPAPNFTPNAADADASAPVLAASHRCVTAAFTCLTPIVAAIPDPDGRPTPRYLRPTDGDAFSDAVRKNLVAKYRVLHGHKHVTDGHPPADDRFRLTFSPTYLADPRHRGGTKKITFGKIDLIGALAPFTLEAAPELLQLAWETGLGQGNSMGFGMVEIDARPSLKEGH